MNKRMRNFLVSLGMVVTLGTNSTFATGTEINATTAAGLKSVIDRADDYTVFANTATIGADFDGNVAANDVTLNGKIGFSSNVESANDEEVVNVSYIERVNSNSQFGGAVTQTGHILALYYKNHNIEAYNQGWRINDKISDDKNFQLILTETKDNLKDIGTNDIDIETVLGNLETASKQLASMTGSTTQLNIQQVKASELADETKNQYIVDIVDADNDADKQNNSDEKKYGYGITIVNVIVDKEEDIEVDKGGVIQKVKTVDIDRSITIRKMNADGTYDDDGYITGDWKPEAGKVLFNFVNTDGTAYDGRIQTSKQFMGTILAPKATVYAKAGNLNGTVICNNFEGNGCQMHHIELNIVDKADDIQSSTDGWINQIEAGDSLLIVPLGVAAVGGVVVYFANRKNKDEDEE